MSGCECKPVRAQPLIDEVSHVGSVLRRCCDCFLCPDVGLYQSGGAVVGADMEYAIAGITAILLFIYLMYALLRPERF